MAIKKSELYSKIWAACDELGRGIDPAIYKNYILTLLFIKYVSDKYANDPYATIRVPAGATYAEMSKLKGNPNIGDLINKRIVEPLFSANNLSGYPDFNSSQNLGDGKEKVERLTNLIATFEDSALDFSGNRAENDDLLGDAYEYLMRNFAMETGKSKGQFYTPTEVSRVIAAIVGIRDAATNAQTTIYDPACGSGSLLLRVANAARTPVSVYGQENDALTAGLVRMNMILHRQEIAEIAQGNSLANPRFLDGTKLKRFDFVVMNPPFSDKGWIKGVNVENDPYGRFAYGVPPAKQGDYAYLLHVLASLKSTGTGVAVMPHGVLFRGNAEATVRENLVKQRLILGIIGLPVNLFYGTGIPACLVVLDKATTKSREGIFMIDASDGFIKDGPKNRLRARDIHKIIDAFARKADIPGYSRMVPMAEIESNEYNLNLPRYIEGLDKEDIQDIDAHLNGGIPARDIDGLDAYWRVCPDLRTALFKPNREGYVDLGVENSAITTTIQENPQYQAFVYDARLHFEAWKQKVFPKLTALEPQFHPKELIKEISEDLLLQFDGNPLIDGYAVYQHLMDYWDATMQDDCYLIAANGWSAEPQRVIEIIRSGKKKGGEKDVGWTCDLVPKEYLVRRYFANDRAQIDDLTSKRDAAQAQSEEFEGEHCRAEGTLDGVKLNKASILRRLQEIKLDAGAEDEIAILRHWLTLFAELSDIKKKLKDAESALDRSVISKYATLSQDEIKKLVVDDKWFGAIHEAMGHELTTVTSTLLDRVVTLGKRYSTTLQGLAEHERELEGIVAGHLVRMQKSVTGERGMPAVTKSCPTPRLGDVAAMNSGGTPLSSVQRYYGGGIPWVSISDMTLQGRFISTTQSTLTEDGVRNSSAKIFPIGTVLYAMYASIGECGIAVVPVTTSQAILGIRVNGTHVIAEFLYYYLSSIKSRVATLGQQGTQANLNKAIVADMRIPLPKISEQRVIASILSDMDAEIDALERKLAKARDIKQGMMQDLLAGSV